MHFGEYELSPSLISLSPLPSTHPEAFQRLLVRSSSWCYPAFNLVKGRSLGFASTTTDYAPSSDSLSLRLRASSHLTLPATVTRRFIMQKARRHSQKLLRPLVGARFQVLFHSSVRSAFHLSLTVLVHYRSLGSMITHTIRFLRGGLRTVKFSSDGGFACHPQRLHSSTGTSVAPRWFHCSVSTSPHAAVTEY